MSAFTKTVWTKIKDGFESATNRSTTSNSASSAPAPPYASRTYFFNGDVITTQDQQGATVRVASPSYKSNLPIFTAAVGIFDIFMLIISYIVQGGRDLTSATWIKLGAKYVPCMKPLSSKVDRLAYAAGLKSQCFSFLFPYQFYRFFTPMFLHLNIRHLLNNLVYQALAGSVLEKKYGTKVFAICYISFGFSGNLMSALLKPKTVSAGASGAVYGLLFFCIIDNVLRIFTKDTLKEKLVQFLIMLLIVPYFIMSVFVDIDFSGNIDHSAHGGGALMGILVSLFLCDMPDFVITRVPGGTRRIQLIALIAIIGYYVISLFVFFVVTPASMI